MKAYVLEVILDTQNEYVEGYYKNYQDAVERSISEFYKILNKSEEEILENDLEEGGYDFSRVAIGKNTGKYLGGVYVKEIKIQGA